MLTIVEVEKGRSQAAGRSEKGTYVFGEEMKKSRLSLVGE